MRRFHFASLLILGVSVYALAGGPNAPKPASELPQIKDLPNPLVFADGSPVRNQEDWERRRVELKDLFQDYVYGHMPPKPEKMSIKRGQHVTDAANKVVTQELDVTLEHEGKSLTMKVVVVVPLGVKGKVPVVIQNGAGDAKRYLERGYAVAEVNFNQIVPDSKDKARSGALYKLFGDKIDCGALMAWAWAMSRVIDASRDSSGNRRHEGGHHRPFALWQGGARGRGVR